MNYARGLVTKYEMCHSEKALATEESSGEIQDSSVAKASSE